MLPVLAVISFFDKLITTIKHSCGAPCLPTAGVRLSCFLFSTSEHHNTTGMTSKMECNVQNNRAKQYAMICEEILI